MTPHLPSLDAVRGFAVLVVFVSHAANDGMLPEWLGNGAGQMGVQLFFLLSGYLMAMCYSTRPASITNIRQFAIGRIARILPLYWLVLVLSALAAGAGLSPHYTFTSWTDLTRAVAFVVAPQELWSIPVEVQFYGVFVLLWMAIGPVRQHIGAITCTAVLIAFFWRGWVSDAMIVVPYLPCFLIGLLICLRQVRLSKVITALGHPATTIACLALFVLNLPGVRGAFDLELVSGFYPKMWLDPFRLLAVALVFLSALSIDNRIWKLPTGLAYLGKISFGVYLIHRPVMKAAEGLHDHIGGVLLAIAVLMVSIAIATLSLNLFERPVQQALKARAVGLTRQSRRPATG